MLLTIMSLSTNSLQVLAFASDSRLSCTDAPSLNESNGPDASPRCQAVWLWHAWQVWSIVISRTPDRLHDCAPLRRVACSDRSIDRLLSFSPSHAAQQQTHSGTGTDSRDKLMKELVRQRTISNKNPGDCRRTVPRMVHRVCLCLLCRCCCSGCCSGCR